MAKFMVLEHPDYEVVTYDCRGHGLTKTQNDNDLSVETLTDDAVKLSNLLFSEKDYQIILVGHSMGGAIAAHASNTNKIKNLIGLVVIDVVEGTALEALPSMHHILDQRPKSFKSLNSAIDWSVSSGMLKNFESARVSIPPQLIQKDDTFVWRTELEKSETYWRGWFENLSKIFLSARVAKCLILAGTDRLDKELTIGQMQGKFQLTLLPAVGHTIQEDNPMLMAQTLIQFKLRNFRPIVVKKIV